MASKSENRRINLYINGKEVKNNIRSIREEYKKSLGQLNHMTRGSKEYYAQVKKIKNLKGMLDQHNKALGRTRRAWSNFKTQIGGWIVAGFGLAAAGRIFSSFINNIKNFEKQASGLSAITGLMGDELEWLKNKALNMNKELKENGIRIKQTAIDILDAYKVVGSAKPELLKNKEALADVTKQAIILSEAAEMSLAEAVKSLTGDLNQFGESADQSARFINVMAAGAQAGAGNIQYISEAIEKSGTTMDLMSISYEQGIALVETVAPRFSKAAMAGNSLDKVLLKMKEKGIGYTNGVFNMNAALLELKTRFDQGETSAQIFGVEHSKMAEVLVQGIDDFNKYTEAVTGTNIATEMAATNTNNLQGSLDSLSANWTNFIIGLNEGHGTLGKIFKGFIDFADSVVEHWQRWTMSEDELAYEKKLKVQQEFIKKFKEHNEGGQQDINDEWNERLKGQLKAFELFGEHYNSAQIRQHNEELKNINHHLDLIRQAKEQIAAEAATTTTTTTTTPTGGGGGTPASPTKTTFDPSSIGSKEIDHILKMNQTAIQLEKQKQKALDDIRNDTLLDLDKSFQQETSQRQTQHNEELLALGDNEEAKTELKEQFRKDEMMRQLAHLKQVMAESQKIIDSGGIEGLNLEDSMLTEEQKEALLERIEELKEKVSEMRLVIAQAEADLKVDVTGMTQEDWDKLEENVSYALMIAQQIGDIWTTINQTITDEEKKNLKEFEKTQDKKKKALKKQLNDGIISEQQYHSKVEQLDSETDAKRRQIEYEQAKRERDAAIFNIIINSLMAFTMALASTSPPYSYILAALSLAMGIAQLASLPPLPAKAKGGYTNGEKAYIAGEAGKEYIAPNWQLNDPITGPIIEGLEQIRLGNASPGIFQPPVSPSEINREIINNYSTDGDKIDVLIEQNELLIDYLSDPDNRRAYINHDDLTRHDEDLAEVQDLAEIS